MGAWTMMFALPRDSSKARKDTIFVKRLDFGEQYKILVRTEGMIREGVGLLKKKQPVWIINPDQEEAREVI